jgi:uncharacterized membrane protein YbaN (DUF454 family)
VIRATFRISAGLLLILVGIIGAFVPIMPTWIFVIPGLAMVGEYFPPARRLYEWGHRKAQWGKKMGQEKLGWNKPKPPSSSV